MELWSKLKTLGYFAIEELMEDGATEGLRLEFKRKTSPDRQGLSDDDKRGLGESYSGMSNAVGGIVLFGVASKKGPDGLDVGSEPQNLSDVQSLANCIETLGRDLLSPANHDLEVISIARPSTTCGIVAIRIGASADRPHMSMAPGHQKYFQRTLDSNRPMLDFQVRDMLRLKSVPRLTIGYDFGRYLGHSGKEYTALVLNVINVGQVTARDTYLVIDASEPALHRVTPVEANFEVMLQSIPGVRAFHSLSGHPLHPGMSMPAVRILCVSKRFQSEGETHISFGGDADSALRPARECSLKLTLKVGSEDAPSRTANLVIGPTELVKAMDASVLGARFVPGRVIDDSEYIRDVASR